MTTCTETTSELRLIRQNDVCRLLAVSRSGLDKLRKRDPSFPVPIKHGDTRQAAAYYVLSEVEGWIAARMASRTSGDGLVSPGHCPTDDAPWPSDGGR